MNRVSTYHIVLMTVGLKTYELRFVETVKALKFNETILQFNKPVGTRSKYIQKHKQTVIIQTNMHYVFDALPQGLLHVA